MANRGLPYLTYFCCLLMVSLFLLNVSLLGTASYLPRPSAVEYEFRYVDRMGEVCACSRPFTFCAPKPLEELETLKEEGEEEDGEEGLLLVIPKAQLLQVNTKGT